jgi:hypothetical protein
MLMLCVHIKKQHAVSLNVFKRQSWKWKCSLAGIVLMFTGLYIVLWAKSNEISADDEEQSLQGGDDAEKALLA